MILSDIGFTIFSFAFSLWGYLLYKKPDYYWKSAYMRDPTPFFLLVKLDKKLTNEKSIKMLGLGFMMVGPLVVVIMVIKYLFIV